MSYDAFAEREQTRTVTLDYLNELYAKAARLRLVEGYLQALDDDAEFRCSIGSVGEWVLEHRAR